MAKESDVEVEEISERIAILKQLDSEEEAGRRTLRDPDGDFPTLEEERALIISITEFLALLGILASQAEDYHLQGE